MLEGAGAAEASLIDDGARVPDLVGPLGTITQFSVTSSSSFGRRGDEEATIGYGDFLEGLEEFKALSMKDPRRRLKNEVFTVTFLFELYFVCHLTLLS